jgi:hypothetical protein
MTSAQLAIAITGTRNNTKVVATLDIAPSDRSTTADYETLRAKLNEVILASKRQEVSGPGGRPNRHATGTCFFLDPLR